MVFLLLCIRSLFYFSCLFFQEFFYFIDIYLILCVCWKSSFNKLQDYLPIILLTKSIISGISSALVLHEYHIQFYWYQAGCYCSVYSIDYDANVTTCYFPVSSSSQGWRLMFILLSPLPARSYALCARMYH